MNERIRVGIVGAGLQGGWAAAAHLPALARLDEFEVTAVATTRESTARQAAQAFGARHAFAGHAELTRHPDVDLVVVSVKAPAHAEVTRAALAAGKHVFCEWPLGATPAETADLAKAAADAGVVHVIGLQGHHSPSALFVRDLLAEGRIGRMQSIAAISSGDPWGGDRIPESLAWGTDAAAGAGLLTIMVGHALPGLEHLAGELTEVSAVVADLHDELLISESGERVANDTPSQVALVGRLRGGAVASLTVQGGGSTAGPDAFFTRIAGTEGTLTLTPVQSGMYPHWTEWSIRLRSRDGTTTDLPVPPAYRLVPDAIPAGPSAHIAALYREIGKAIRERREATPNFTTALRYHRLLETLRRADTDHTPVR